MRTQNAWFHEVRESVSRAIMSSSFVGMTRHSRPDSVLIRPLLSLPFSSFSFGNDHRVEDGEMREHLCSDRRVVFFYVAGKDECID